MSTGEPNQPEKHIEIKGNVNQFEEFQPFELKNDKIEEICHEDVQKEQTKLSVDSIDSQLSAQRPEPDSEEKEKQQKQQPFKLTQSFHQEQKVEKTEEISMIEKESIIKSAEKDRIGDTYDFFYSQMNRYGHHAQCRKKLLINIREMIEKQKKEKDHILKMLKEYFKHYSETAINFHQKSYDLQFPMKKEESENRIINLKQQLKEGLQKLINLRRKVGDNMSRIQKFIDSEILPQIYKRFETYWSVMETQFKKIHSKEENFEDSEKKFIKRIDKILKLYTKSRYGFTIEEDLFVEMTKFVREENSLRQCLFQWGKQTVTLRKNIILADSNLMNQLDTIIATFKTHTEGIYKTKKRKYSFSEQIKPQILKQFQYNALLTPTDLDYIIGVRGFLTGKSETIVKEQDFEEFLLTDPVEKLVGCSFEFLKGAIIKSFQLKNPEQELLKTVSGNLILYNRKHNQVRNKLKISDTQANFLGKGIVELKEVVKGIIFDSDNLQKIYFSDDNRAEELIMALEVGLIEISQPIDC